VKFLLHRYQANILEVKSFVILFSVKNAHRRQWARYKHNRASTMF